MEHQFYSVDWYRQWYFTWRWMLLSLPNIMTFIHLFLNPTHHFFLVLFTCVPSLYFTVIYCPPVYPCQSSHMGWFPNGLLWLPLSSSGSYNFKNQFPSPFHHNTDTNFRYFKRDVSAFRLWLFQVVVCAWGALTFWDSRGSPLFQTIDFDLTPFSVTPFSFSHLSKMWDRHDSCSCSSTALKPFSTFYCRRARP